MGSTPTYATDALAPSTGAVLKLQPHGAAPPTNAYVNGNSLLLVQIWNAAPNATITIVAQILLPDGTLSLNAWPCAVTSDRTRNNFKFSLTEGFLISMSVLGAAANFANRTWVSVRLQNAPGGGVTLSEAFFQGYISFTQTLSWPPGNQENSADGPGAIVSVTGTLPGAGVEISETVPANVVWLLKSFTFQLTTSAAVANRIPHLIVDDGTHVLLDSPATSVLAAGATGRYVTGDDAFVQAATDGTQWMQFVADLRMMPGYRMRTVTTALQAGDQYTAPQYLVKEWLFQ